jgi:hypothetical protein
MAVLPSVMNRFASDVPWRAAQPLVSSTAATTTQDRLTFFGSAFNQSSDRSRDRRRIK